MSEIWITSDTHFFHRNLALGSSTWEDKSGCRPFKDEIEMTDVIVSNINKLVASHDTLYHLGDWSFGGIQNIQKAREMLNVSKIYLTRGNHDHHLKKSKYKSLFYRVYDHYTEKKILEQYVCLCHYAMLQWNHRHHNSWHWFGHSHSTLNSWIDKHLPQAKMLDVGLEGHDYKPWHFDEIREYMSKKQGECIDHHV